MDLTGKPLISEGGLKAEEEICGLIQRLFTPTLDRASSTLQNGEYTYCVLPYNIGTADAETADFVIEATSASLTTNLQRWTGIPSPQYSNRQPSANWHVPRLAVFTGVQLFEQHVEDQASISERKPRRLRLVRRRDSHGVRAPLREAQFATPFRDKYCMRSPVDLVELITGPCSDGFDLSKLPGPDEGREVAEPYIPLAKDTADTATVGSIAMMNPYTVDPTLTARLENFAEMASAIRRFIPELGDSVLADDARMQVGTELQQVVGNGQAHGSSPYAYPQWVECSDEGKGAACAMKMHWDMMDLFQTTVEGNSDVYQVTASTVADATRHYVESEGMTPGRLALAAAYFGRTDLVEALRALSTGEEEGLFPWAIDCDDLDSQLELFHYHSQQVYKQWKEILAAGMTTILCAILTSLHARIIASTPDRAAVLEAFALQEVEHHAEVNRSERYAEQLAHVVFSSPNVPTYEVGFPSSMALQVAVRLGLDAQHGNPQMFGFAVAERDDDFLKTLFMTGLPIAGKVGAGVLSPWSGGGQMMLDTNECDPVTADAREADRVRTVANLPRADAALNYALQHKRLDLAQWLIDQQGADAARPELFRAATSTGDCNVVKEKLEFLTRNGARFPVGSEGIEIAIAALKQTREPDVFEYLLAASGTAQAPARLPPSQATELAYRFAKGYCMTMAKYMVTVHGADVEEANRRLDEASVVYDEEFEHIPID